MNDDDHDFWRDLNRVERYDTMGSGWFDGAVEALLDGEAVEIFDWRPGGRTRLIQVSPSWFDRRRALAPRLKKILRDEGVAGARFRRGVAP